MGLSTAMTTAITGLSTHQTALDNIGNNIANVNTTSYKSGIYSFSTLMEETMSTGTASDATTGRGSTNAVTLGLGVQTSAITKDYTQGSLSSTGVATDMAISGNGYFILRSGNSNVYTRDGSFYLGSDGSLLGSSGLQVQGIMADVDGNLPEDVTTVEDINIAIGETGAASETTTVSFTGNLDSEMDLAVGLNIIGTGVADATVLASLGTTTTTDGSWDALNTTTDGMINGGSVLTSTTLAAYDSGTGTYAAATSTTDLADLCYLNGETWTQPFAGITDGEKISITFEKGGSTFSASFTYSTATSTVEDFMTFLAGDYDNVASATTITDLTADANTSTQGGVMGCVDVAANVDATGGGTDAYDTQVETAGSFGRTFTGTADYDGDGTYDDDAYAISIVSNLGEDNSITSLSVSYNNVRYNNMFTTDSTYGTTTGGSATTQITVYDSLGNAKVVDVTLTKVSMDSNFSTYRWIATSQDDTDAIYELDSSGNLLTSSVVGTGLIRFDSNGNYVAGADESETDGIEVTLKDQGVNDAIVISLRNGLSSDQTQNLDFSALTQVATDSTFNLKDQDGTAPGTLDSFSVTEDGVIQGVYSNGVVQTIARVCIALVPNENGLISMGDNLYTTGPSSGDAQIGYAGAGGRGAVKQEYLESSNVDLGTELTTMITIERGYQANARIVTTADEMLQELVNLGR